MRRSKIGDVYFIRLPNGIKIFQRAYDIPRIGRFIRVFGGLFNTIPDNIERIISGPHSYIINFHSSRAYRIGLIELIGNYPVPDEYPFPCYMFDFWQNASGIRQIRVRNVDFSYFKAYDVGRLEDLPEKFRNLTLLSMTVSPDWLLYLFDTNWNPSNLMGFFPNFADNDCDNDYQVYVKMVAEAMDK